MTWRRFVKIRNIKNYEIKTIIIVSEISQIMWPVSTSYKIQSVFLLGETKQRSCSLGSHVSILDKSSLADAILLRRVIKGKQVFLLTRTLARTPVLSLTLTNTQSCNTSSHSCRQYCGSFRLNKNLYSKRSQVNNIVID